MDFNNIWNGWDDAENFSGMFSVSGEQGVIFEKFSGLRNRSENLLINPDTAFGIASGTKMFTGLAICKLIDHKRLSLRDRIWDLLPYDLGKIDKRVTVFHLLTHTSGIGDYIDEEADNDTQQLQALYDQYPVYLWERLEYYLPMITPLTPKFEPGARFGYSNAGFVMLGLIIEAISGLTYQQFMQYNIITPLGLTHTGFFRLDDLPANTAYGYIRDEKTQKLRSNIYCMPVIGGSDGGLFTSAKDIDRVWRALCSNEILSEGMTISFLKPRVKMREADEDHGYYGLGVYVEKKADGNHVYYAVGGDFGVEFFTAYFPKQKITASLLANNTESKGFRLLNTILNPSS